MRTPTRYETVKVETEAVQRYEALTCDCGCGETTGERPIPPYHADGWVEVTQWPPNGNYLHLDFKDIEHLKRWARQ